MTKSKTLRKLEFFSLKMKKYYNSERGLPTTLYHYTKSDSMLEIIKSQNLLLTRFNELNDKKEFIFSKENIYKIHDKLKNRFSSRILDKFENFLNDIDIYMISFCLDKQNNKLWEKYGDNHKGCALGFTPKHENREIDYKKIYPPVIMEVKYGKMAYYADFGKYVETFFRALKCAKSNEYNDFLAQFIVNVYPAMPRYKAIKWKNEREYRYCMMDRTPLERIPLEHKEANKACARGIVVEQLAEVIIGKKCELNEEEVKSHLIGYSDSIKIFKAI